MRFLALYLLIAAITLLVGCGGGGNDVADVIEDPVQAPDDFAPRDLSFLLQVQTSVGLDSRTGSDLAAYTGEGASEDAIVAKPGATALLREGTYGWARQENRDGIRTDSSPAGMYSVDEDGTLRFTAPGDTPQGRGAVSANGHYGFVAHGEGGNGLHLMAFVTTPESVSFDETGAYHMIGYSRFVASGMIETTINTTDLQSGHTMAHRQGLQNLDGVVSTRSAQYQDYERDGAFLRVGNPLDHAGSFSPDGQVAIAGGSLVAGGSPHVRILIREHTAATDATLKGTFYVGAMGGHAPFRSARGIVTFDGQGGGTYEVDVTDGTNSNPSSSISFTYEVGSGGTVAIDIGGQLLLHGAVSEDGQFLAFAGGMRNGEPPMVAVLIRR